MSITQERKTEIIKEYGNNPGAVDTQVAILTERISNLTEHFKVNKKDHASKRGLLVLVNRRKKLLKYYRRRNEQAYQQLIEKLGLRK
ncbi:MAG: 30S ribosomal protein S15 [Candidatus Marinimicrobia bacterium]|nr:30S ribosomal protein S15 [Candidatus Neomarinimicrobiota bacterium]